METDYVLTLDDLLVNALSAWYCSCAEYVYTCCGIATQLNMPVESNAVHAITPALLSSAGNRLDSCPGTLLLTFQPMMFPSSFCNYAANSTTLHP
jgi:hypothetical protein